MMGDRKINITSCCKVEIIAKDSPGLLTEDEEKYIVPIYTQHWDREESLTNHYFYICPSCKRPCAVTEKEEKE